MSKNIRVIPRLDIKGPNLVKGIHLEGLRVLGKPEQFARYYYETGADELVYMDVVASLYNRNSLHDIIKKTANEIFIPLTVGGGLRTIEDIREVLRVGADKISLNTAAIKNPQIIKEASRKFGSSTILISIEAIRQTDGKYLAYTDNGREYTGIEVIQWAKKVEELGAGEIMITSIDKEGTGIGYDIELTKNVSEAVSIPVIASGGAGNVEHTAKVIQEGMADAIAIASILHYGVIRNHEFAVDTAKEGNREFLKTGRISSNIKPSDLQQIKQYLHENGFACRYDKYRNILTGHERNTASCHH
jgi:imidazole glycerol-phosphate synthase subunit HisF